MVTCLWSPSEAVQLMEWFQKHKRDLPWRRLEENPYAVWISEIMLQQTQVATVIGYFNRWMARFPTVEALAAAPVEDVLKCWEGLGYYARARNIHRAAVLICEEFGGKLPHQKEALNSLPGIGPYTTGAILSLAFRQREAIVDTNVERVLTRRFGLDGDPKSPSVRRQIWKLAEDIIPEGGAREFNSALMELGALVCMPADPVCSICPFAASCSGYLSGNPQQWPQLVAGKRIVRVEQACVALREDDRWLFVRRPDNGLWGGLWEFPRREIQAGESQATCAERAALETLGVQALVTSGPFTVKHTVTHYAITLYGYTGKISPGGQNVIAELDHKWVTPAEVLEMPLSSPQRKLAEKLMGKHLQKDIP